MRKSLPSGLGGILLAVALAALAGCSGDGGPIARLQARLHLKDGNQAYLDGHFKAAIEHYDAATRVVPRLAPAYLNKAYSQEALFRAAATPEEKQALAADAADTFNKYLDLVEHGGIGLNADSPGAQRVEEHIVTLLVDSKQYEKAVEQLKARYDRNPRDTSALEMLSRLDMERGNLDEAMEWQRKRVEVEPDNPDAQYSLGAFVWLASYRNPNMDATKRGPLLDEGIAALDRSLELRPNDFESLIYLNLVYLEKAKYSTSDEERAGLEAKAKGYRDRALALRKAAASADSTRKAPSDSAGAPAAAPAPAHAAPDTAQRVAGGTAAQAPGQDALGEAGR